MQGQGCSGWCYLCGTRSSEDLCINNSLSKQFTYTTGSGATDTCQAVGCEQARGLGGEVDPVLFSIIFSPDMETFVIRPSIHSITHSWVCPFLFLSSRERGKAAHLITPSFLPLPKQRTSVLWAWNAGASAIHCRRSQTAHHVPSPLFSSFLHFNPQMFL